MQFFLPLSREELHRHTAHASISQFSGVSSLSNYLKLVSIVGYSYGFALAFRLDMIFATSLLLEHAETFVYYLKYLIQNIGTYKRGYKNVSLTQ